MARLKVSESPAPGLNEDLWEASPRPTQRRPANNAPEASSVSPTPSATSVSSDKENRTAHSRADKGKGRDVMGAPALNRGLSVVSNGIGSKRKAVDGTDGRRASRRRTIEPENEPRSTLQDANEDSEDYNPDQSVEERRKIRAKLRNLEKYINENRAECLLPDNDGLRQTLLEADQITSGVKQTSDATIDSRLLVNTADLSLKKVEKLTLGDSELRVDIDHFLAKCMSFMRRGNNGSASSSSRAPAATQSRPRQPTQNVADNSDDDDDPEAGDMLDWSHLGAFASLQHNSRPPVPGFLLGPLSLEKRLRKVTQRRANNANKDLAETRPEILRPEDIEKSENSNLTVLCTRIMDRLVKVADSGMDACEQEAWDGMTDVEMKGLMLKHAVNEEGAVDLFKFVVNPKSFGQTVENLFYVSFLIRDGKAGITIDDDGLPYLKATEPRKREDAVANGIAKHQAVLAIDMATWEELIEVFEIHEPMIEHRKEVVQRTVGARGWYS